MEHETLGFPVVVQVPVIVKSTRGPSSSTITRRRTHENSSYTVITVPAIMAVTAVNIDDADGDDRVGRFRYARGLLRRLCFRFEDISVSTYTSMKIAAEYR